MTTTILFSRLLPERVGSGRPKNQQINVQQVSPSNAQTNLLTGDRSQFAWDSNFALYRRRQLLSRHRETRSEPIADLVGDNFNDSHARVVHIAFVDAIT